MTLIRSRWAAVGAAVAVTFGAGGLFAAQAATTPTSVSVPVDATRVLDTRTATNIELAGPFWMDTHLATNPARVAEAPLCRHPPNGVCGTRSRRIISGCPAMARTCSTPAKTILLGEVLPGEGLLDRYQPPEERAGFDASAR